MQRAGYQRASDAHGVELAEIFYITYTACSIDLPAHNGQSLHQSLPIRSRVAANLWQGHGDHPI